MPVRIDIAGKAYEMDRETYDRLADRQADLTGFYPKKDTFPGRIAAVLAGEDDRILHPFLREDIYRLASEGAIAPAGSAAPAPEGHREPRPERLFRLISGGGDGWREYLKTMAEHPEMSPRNLLALTEYRLESGLKSTQELLTFDKIGELGGTVAKGAKGVSLSRPVIKRDDEGRPHFTGEFEYERLFAAGVCRGLDPKRYRGYPMRVNPESTESLDMFMRATSHVDLDSMDAVSRYVFDLRYGTLVAGEPAPEPPAAQTPAELEAALKALGERARVICRRVDRELKLARHPEWVTKRDLAERGAANPPDVEAAPASMDPKNPSTEAIKAALGARKSGKQAPRAPEPDSPAKSI